MQLSFDLESARKARERGVDSVIANGRNWFNVAMRFVADLPCGWTGIGEDLRILVAKSEAGMPHRDEAWGALILHAKRRGLLEPTGVRRQMKSVSSHARATDEYRRTAVDMIVKGQS